MKKISICVMLLSIFMIGCNTASNSSNVRHNSTVVAKVVDYGNGVYYFNSVDADFANDLSAFIHEHPAMELVSLTGNGTCSYGRDCGYFVVFRDKH